MSFYEGIKGLAKEIATGVFGNGAAKALRSDLGEMGRNRVSQLETSAANDLINTMTNNGIKFEDNALKEMRESFSQLGMDRDAIVQKISGAKTDGDLSQKAIEDAIKAYKDGGTKLKTYIDAGGGAQAASEYLGKKDGALGAWNMATGYFGDATNGSVRRKVAAAGTVGSGVALRYLSGGNLTTNAQGERDIAGIPFF